MCVLCCIISRGVLLTLRVFYIVSPAAVLVVGAVESIADVPTALRRCFTHEVDVSPPDDVARVALLTHHLAKAMGSQGAQTLPDPTLPNPAKP
jgi:SpoVK/Ycf46/Vps4 family AAA+-type ATPase